MKSCVDLLSAKMVDVRSVLSFISNNEDGATVQKLLKELGVKTKKSKQDCDKQTAVQKQIKDQQFR